jgi:molecular chaperone IbpA
MSLTCLRKEKKMTSLTRFDTSTLHQLNKALVGFDRIFNDMESRFVNQVSTNYPPYNIEKVGENLYDIVIAVAGFDKNEISVEVDQDQLIIRGEKLYDGKTPSPEYLHRGLAFRDFERKFTLAEHMEILKAEIKNGLLSIRIERKVPEELLPRKITITVQD